MLLLAVAASQPIMVGSPDDIRFLKKVAAKCRVEVKAQKLDTTPAIWVEMDTFWKTPEKQLDCFFEKVIKHKFSKEHFLVGNAPAEEPATNQN